MDSLFIKEDEEMRQKYFFNKGIKSVPKMHKCTCPQCYTKVNIHVYDLKPTPEFKAIKKAIKRLRELR